MTRTRPIGARHRMTACAVLALALAVPAHAQEGPRAHYRAMSDETVRGIEVDLIWAGATDAVANGRIGRRDIRAIRDFEVERGLGVDGILRPYERRVLDRVAGEARERVGYTAVRDEATGVRLGLPGALLGPRIRVENGSRWSAPDGGLDVFAYRVTGRDLEAVYRGQMARPGREVTYDVLRDDFFVVAGTENGRDFYYRAAGTRGAEGNEVRAFAVVHDGRYADIAPRLITAMSNDFEAFPRGRPSRPERSVDPRSELRPDRPVAAGGPCGGQYRVRRGDTLYAIALRCSTTVPALLDANRRIDPLSLRVGEVLRVPDRRGVFPDAPVNGPTGGPSIATSASILSAPPRPGGTVEASARGFRPGEVVEAGFGRDAERFIVTRIARADAEGRVRLSMTLPGRFGAGDTVVVSFANPDGSRNAAARPFAVRGAEPRREALTITGMLTTEGARCPALRDVDGRLFTLRGDLPDYAPGTPVRVEAVAGTALQNETCAQGRTVELRSVARR